MITSIKYGSPRLTDATPRFKAADSFDGSVIGPSAHQPIERAQLIRVVLGQACIGERSSVTGINQRDLAIKVASEKKA